MLASSCISETGTEESELTEALPGRLTALFASASASVLKPYSGKGS